MTEVSTLSHIIPFDFCYFLSYSTTVSAVFNDYLMVGDVSSEEDVI